MTPTEVDRLLRPLQLKDLRLIARSRGLNPAGGKEQLEDRLKQHMLSSGNFSVQTNEGGDQAAPAGFAVAPQGYQQYSTGGNNNNYSRPGGQQNVGNFITDRPSSHVMAPPGGYSTLQLGGYNDAPAVSHYQPPQAPYGTAPQEQNTYGASAAEVRGNNYSRPGGQQNVGNFITDRPSSRVSNPPGGASQIAFGDNNLPHAAPQGYNQQYPSPAPAPYAVMPQQNQGGYGYGSPAPGNQHVEAAHNSNNYSRPGGQQNVGNFITDRPSSRVLAPPGGKSQISFG